MLSEVHGQDEGVRYLRRVIEGHIVSPLLLVGKEGVGKKFSVLEAAKEYFSRGDPSDTYHALQIAQGLHPDLKLLEREAGATEITKEPIVDLTSSVFHYPTYAPARFVVIDGADYMNSAAANALLKTLEEPPSTVRFFLLAESESDVLPTIRSRCGLVRYHALPEAYVVARIQQFEPDVTKALVLSRLAEGSVGRAIAYWGSGRLRLRDQVLELLKPDLLNNPATLFAAIDSIGVELVLGIRFLEHLLHDILLIALAPDRISNLDIANVIKRMHETLGVERAKQILYRLRTVQAYLDRGTRIHLTTHVKSALV